MRSRPNHLRLVPPGRARIEGPTVEAGDVALLASLFAVNLIPLAGAAAHAGAWSGGTLGLAAAGALISGRELVAELGSLVRARR